MSVSLETMIVGAFSVASLFWLLRKDKPVES